MSPAHCRFLTAWNCRCIFLYTLTIKAMVCSETATALPPPLLATLMPSSCNAAISIVFVPALLARIPLGRLEGGQPIAISGIIPALEVRLAFLGERPTRFHQVFLGPVILELRGEALQRRCDPRPHLPHHVDGVHARCRGQC